ncbi:MAG TPA: DMT family transporter [Methylomirabilota bacterium]|jgi:drug/metabolite transporter (DMT)-like permease
MPATALALVLMAAVLHTGWNALAKRGRDQLCFLWWAITVATIMATPISVPLLMSRGVPAAARPFIAATIAVHVIYFFTLGRAYRSGEFSVVYPVSRGLGVALVPVLAAVFFDERPSALGAVGVALVVAGIVALQLISAGPRRMGNARRDMAPGVWWALAAGLTIAGYSLVDKGGVARLHPVPYIQLMFLGMSLLLLPVVLADPNPLRREWTANWRTIIPAAVMTMGAYLLVLFAFQLSKAAYVVATREVSIVLSALIGSVWFEEGRLLSRLAGAAVVLAGVVCVALAR